MAKLGIRNNKMLIFMCINLTNLCCHSVYSVLAAFFPQEAKKKGISEDAVGIVFASFAGVICLCSPMAGGWMTHYGKVWVYITGIVLVSVSTVLFAGATMMPDGMPFGSWCLSMRLLQGVGSAMEEARPSLSPVPTLGAVLRRAVLASTRARAPARPADGGVRHHRRPRPGEPVLLPGHHRDLHRARLHGDAANPRIVERGLAAAAARARASPLGHVRTTATATTLMQ